jgi:hypothetical protein
MSEVENGVQIFTRPAFAWLFQCEAARITKLPGAGMWHELATPRARPGCLCRFRLGGGSDLKKPSGHPSMTTFSTTPAVTTLR